MYACEALHQFAHLCLQGRAGSGLFEVECSGAVGRQFWQGGLRVLLEEIGGSGGFFVVGGMGGVEGGPGSGVETGVGLAEWLLTVVFAFLQHG